MNANIPQTAFSQRRSLVKLVLDVIIQGLAFSPVISTDMWIFFRICLEKRFRCIEI